VQQDRFTYNGLYHKTVLDALSLIWLVLFVCTCCVLVRSKNDTIFDAVTLKQYLTYLQPRIFVGVLCVRVVLAVANSLYFSYLFLGRFNPSPTLPIGANNVQTPVNSAMVLENISNVKEVSCETT
jgi:hypothetical protein